MLLLVPGFGGTELWAADKVWINNINPVYAAYMMNYMMLMQGEECKYFTIGGNLSYRGDIDYFVKIKNKYPSEEFLYDWRLSLWNTDTLRRLHSVLSGHYIIAHSSGGILVKNYIEKYGREKISGVINVGVPFRGIDVVDNMGNNYLYPDMLDKFVKNLYTYRELISYDNCTGVDLDYTIYNTNDPIVYNNCGGHAVNATSNHYTLVAEEVVIKKIDELLAGSMAGNIVVIVLGIVLVNLIFLMIGIVILCQYLIR